MGGSCSLQRQRALWHQHRQNSQDGSNPRNARNGGRTDTRRSVRHSVDSEVPDGSISALYPIEDNYVVVAGNRRSPKNLSELCIEAVCRSLPNLDGDLPPGLPQDIVDAIVKSLIRHAALNATTLRALRHCELGELSLAGCRGVSDEWLVPLSSSSNNSFMSSPHDNNGMPPQHYVSPEDLIDQMDLDHHTQQGPFTVHLLDDHKHQNERNHGTFEMDGVEGSVMYRDASEEASSSSCSTSSFVSASSTPFPTGSGLDDTHSFSSPHQSSTMAPFDEIMSQSMMEDLHSCSPFHRQSSLLLPPLTSNLTLLDLRGSQRLTDRGLMQLSELSSLEVVKLDNCHSLVGRGLMAFSSSHRLRTLSLANCRRLTDEAVVNISHLSSITALSLDGCRCLTDRSLAAIANLYELQKLDLSQCDLITNDGLRHLNNLEYIEELSLGWCRSITDRGIKVLTSQSCRAEKLKILRIARCSITDVGIAQIGKLRSLEELDLNGCSNIGSAALASTLERLTKLSSLDVSYCPGILRVSWQGKIKALKSLELCYSGVRDAHLSRLTNLPALEELNLDSCPVGDWAISHLADNNVVPNLHTLDLADTDLTDLGMVHLPKFENLTRLSLFYCNITNAGLQHLSSMTNLEVLNLDSREIGDDGLSHLRNLSRLRSLDVFSGRITDMGCAHLSKIKSLESLELCGGGVGDLGCAHLASLENLTSLNLSQNERITNRGAASLAALTKLKALNLSNTRVNSAALRFLGGLVRLQSLALYGCRGIKDGASIENLQSELPSLKCLRLNSTSDNDGVIETNIDPEDYEGQDSDIEGTGGLAAAAHIRRGSEQSDSASEDQESDINDDDFPVNETENDGASDVDESDDSDSIGLDEMDVASDDGSAGHAGEHDMDGDDASTYSDHD